MKLHTHHQYPGAKGDLPLEGGVSFWFKQDEIHDATHVHSCPPFLSWHREIVNRFEALIRQVDPALSLHYWDWTQDPRAAPDGAGGTVDLFTEEFMGLPDDGMGNEGPAGNPWEAAVFYDTNAAHPQRDVTGKHGDPPASVTRGVGLDLSNPLITKAQDDAVIAANDYPTMRALIEPLHNQIHSYVGGTISNAHVSFRDPFVFLLHSNVDRLFAMWQRNQDPLPHPDRLNPATVYGSEANTKGSGSVTLSPHSPWGILSPIEPWAGTAAQTAATGIVGNFLGVRPWELAADGLGGPPDYQAVDKDSRDPSVVFPPSYDTVPHSAYFILDRSTFSVFEVAASATYPAAMTLIYDGFSPNELGGNPPAPPAFQITFDNPGGPAASAFIAVSVEPAQLEDPTAGPDVPQRISFPVDIQITDQSVFNGFVDTRFVFLRATHGINVTDTGFELTKQPSPYMLDVLNGNVSWLSTDVRVFKLTPGGKLANSAVSQPDPSVDPNAPLTFITNLLGEFRGIPDLNNDPNHPFEKITQDEQASGVELSQTEGSSPVFNYAVAKVRYRAITQPASNVQMFFRTFSTLRSALDYAYVPPNNPPTINYRRSGVWPNAVPLLGLIDGEIASIPYFASGRVDSTLQAMTAQLVDAPNVQTINASGAQEAVMFFGCWLDFNQPTARFPFNPVGDGPFLSGAQPIPAVMNGLHQCLVAEIHFEPGGGTDPIPSGSTPASSDRLAQRNLAFVGSGNPGGGATHTVQHTFQLKPSTVQVDLQHAPEAFAVAQRGGPDELMIRWNNLPRATKATLYVPEWDVDAVLRLAAERQHPAVLHKVDAHTLGIDIADVGFVPIPGFILNSYAGLITLELPLGVRVGQEFRVDFHQYSRSRARFNGAFRLTIPVQTDEALLPAEIRHLAVLRYIAQARPSTSRWQPIFGRWLAGLAAKVRGLGGNPDQVPPSLSDPGGVVRPPREEECVSGKVGTLLYDCFGDFEGFVLEDCDGAHCFVSCEKGIEAVVYRACRERARLTVRFDPHSRRIRGLVVGCC